MKTTDWNWLLVSVVLSTVAIVGIFGAFIIKKTLANQCAYKEKSRRINELIAASKKIADTSSRLPFDWYHRQKNTVEIKKIEEILKNDPNLDEEILYQRLSFSPYLPRVRAISIISTAKKNCELTIGKNIEIKYLDESLRKFVLPNEYSRLATSSTLPQNPQLHSLLNNIQIEINAAYMEANKQSRLVADLYKNVEKNPESSRFVTISLIFISTLFFSGVIYPLSFTSPPDNLTPDTPSFAIRSSLLAGISFIFYTTLTLLLIMNIRLRYPNTLLEQLEKFQKISAYSIFFEHREINGDQ